MAVCYNALKLCATYNIVYGMTIVICTVHAYQY